MSPAPPPPVVGPPPVFIGIDPAREELPAPMFDERQVLARFGVTREEALGCLTLDGVMKAKTPADIEAVFTAACRRAYRANKRAASSRSS